MLLRLSDPSYTDRLATFLRSLGQTVLAAAGPGQLEVAVDEPRTRRGEATYLRVWSVLYPDAEVQIGNGDGADEDDGDMPAA
jgi:hypothetical protein